MQASYLLFALVFFLVNMIQTITGFAGGVLAMPAGMALLGRQTTAAQINFLGLFLSLYVAVRERKQILWKRVARMLALMGIGILLGFFLQQYLDATFLYRIYGGFLLFAVALLVLRREKGISGLAGWGLLILAGVIHAFFVSGGPLVVVYAMAKISDKAEFRATINAVWCFINLLLIAQHWYAGAYTAAFFSMWIVLIPAMVLGIAAGYWIYQKTSQQAFMKLSYTLMVFMGILIMVRA